MFTLSACVILLLVHVMWLFGQENVIVAYEQSKAVGYLFWPKISSVVL